MKKGHKHATKHRVPQAQGRDKKCNQQVQGESVSKWVRVQEIFGFSFNELMQRVAAKIQHLDATSNSPLTEAVLWTTQPAA